MTSQASGTFRVKMEPQGAFDEVEGISLGRMSIDKTFEGDLEGTSLGTMLAAGTKVKGSAGYVAIERVIGTLQGRAGGFVLMHTGLMDRGTPSLKITVVPDSGTGALVGISGTLDINVADGKHLYIFDYTLPDRPQS